VGISLIVSQDERACGTQTRRLTRIFQVCELVERCCQMDSEEEIRRFIRG
jgi:hypothetical protein